ncbi:hypothetical protein CBR_g38053 [Chara braunii]|uniref:Uncharacterized protein n=1 Tax=Chara braunii TaxID=69332 RepID=A0A388K0F1_CHABU|nr:hypothetical protein CBR_g38053 [Chara braunii]|eukprot:GBG63433.1 hypothetical protein CBR_g38053 [Chara braunii]
MARNGGMYYPAESVLVPGAWGKGPVRRAIDSGPTPQFPGHHPVSDAMIPEQSVVVHCGPRRRQRPPQQPGTRGANEPITGTMPDGPEAPDRSVIVQLSRKPQGRHGQTPSTPVPSQFIPQEDPPAPRHVQPVQAHPRPPVGPYPGTPGQVRYVPSTGGPGSGPAHEQWAFGRRTSDVPVIPTEQKFRAIGGPMYIPNGPGSIPRPAEEVSHEFQQGPLWSIGVPESPEGTHEYTLSGVCKGKASSTSEDVESGGSGSRQGGATKGLLFCGLLKRRGRPCNACNRA